MTNQLVAEAERLPDLDEYAGLSLADICLAVANRPAESEDQQRAIGALRARLPGIGHNKPPLEEALDEELAPLIAQRDRLVDTALKAVIVDDASAGKVSDLMVQMSAFEEDVDKAREARVRPYLDAQRLINARFKEARHAVIIARQGENARGGLRLMLTRYEDKREEEARIAREKAAAEAHKRQEEAEKARQAAEAKAAEGKSGAAEAIAAAKAQEAADAAQRRAEAIRPEPIRSQLGQVNRRREIQFDVTDLVTAAVWLADQPGLQNNLRQAVTTILGTYFRGLGVEAVEKGIEIPGVSVRVAAGMANVRR